MKPNLKYERLPVFFFFIVVCSALLIPVQTVAAQKNFTHSFSYSIRKSGFPELSDEPSGKVTNWPELYMSPGNGTLVVPDNHVHYLESKLVSFADSSRETRFHAKDMSIAERVLRFETIAIGSFPITLLYSGIIYSIGRYAFSGFNQTYAPWILGAGGTDSDSQYVTLAIAAGFSLVIATIDLVKGQK